jgi:predicted HAD superfamily phosphohydrolase YqeG
MGINCLALDFDKTLISLHTESRWNREALRLLQLVSRFVSYIIISLFLYDQAMRLR